MELLISDIFFDKSVKEMRELAQEPVKVSFSNEELIVKSSKKGIKNIIKRYNLREGAIYMKGAAFVIVVPFSGTKEEVEIN